MTFYKFIENHWSATIALIASMVAIVLNYLGLISAEKINTFTLIIVSSGSIALSVYLRRLYEKLDELREPQKVEIIDIKEFYYQLRRSLNSAESIVRLSLYQDKSPYETEIKERFQYFTYIDKFIEEGKVPVHRIMTITNEEIFDVALRWIEKHSENKNFFLMHYGPTSGDFVNPNSVIIIDQSVCFIVNPATGKTAQGKPTPVLKITDNKLISLYTEYYDGVCERSKVIKHGTTINTSHLSNVSKELNIDPKKVEEFL